MRKTFLAFLLPLAIVGAAYAGGEHCNGDKAAHHGDKALAGHAHGEHKGEHCALAKGVKKSATMTDDGAVVVLEGKDADAVKRIQAHLGEHEKKSAEECPGCPFGMDGVNATVRMTDNGGEVTFSSSNPETVKHLQEWAKKPAGSCCGGNKKAA
jgi:hypothetical protein